MRGRSPTLGGATRRVRGRRAALSLALHPPPARSAFTSLPPTGRLRRAFLPDHITTEYGRGTQMLWVPEPRILQHALADASQHLRSLWSTGSTMFPGGSGPLARRPQKAEAATQLFHRREETETADPLLGTHISGFTPQCFLFLTAQSSQAVCHILLQGWFCFHHFRDMASAPPAQAQRDTLPVAGHFGHQASGHGGLREQRCPHLLAQP